ncbi:MAG: deoxyribonuclease IV [Mycoplasma sp.]
MNKLLIGSHVSMSSPKYLLGSVKEALSYDSNTFMIYTGPPQNGIRKNTSEFFINEAFELMKDNSINPDNIIVHAPYIINLCSAKLETRESSKEILINELRRVQEMGFNKFVLHPGSKLDQDWEVGINQIAEGLDKALETVNNDVIILLETMSGKGTEMGRDIKDLKAIFAKLKNKNKNKVAVCLDTCHLWDSGIELSNFDNYLSEFDKEIGIDKILCVHVNDSKNVLSSHKDRHDNLGYGNIGFEKLIAIIYHEKLTNVPKILETPYYEKDGKLLPPYKEEIEMIKNKTFKDWM